MAKAKPGVSTQNLKAQAPNKGGKMPDFPSKPPKVENTKFKLTRKSK